MTASFRKISFLLGMIVLIKGATNTYADLIGDEVLIEYSLNGALDSQTVEVMQGVVEINCLGVLADPSICVPILNNQPFGAELSIDIEASSITFNFFDPDFASANFNGFVFSGLDWVDTPNGIITGASLNTDLFGGVDASDLSFRDHFVSINFEGAFVDPEEESEEAFATINIQTNHAVPEPTTLGLLGMGLLALIGYIRRREDHQA